MESREACRCGPELLPQENPMHLPDCARLVSLLAVILVAPATQNAAAPAQEPIRLLPDGASVAMQLDGIPLGTFLASARGVLGGTVQWLPDQVSGVTLHETGEQIVPRDGFRDAFDAVLRRAGFWTWDDDSGGASVIVVRPAWTGATR